MNLFEELHGEEWRNLREEVDVVDEDVVLEDLLERATFLSNVIFSGKKPIFEERKGLEPSSRPYPNVKDGPYRQGRLTSDTLRQWRNEEQGSDIHSLSEVAASASTTPKGTNDDRLG